MLDILGEEAERRPRLLRPRGPVGRRGRAPVRASSPPRSPWRSPAAAVRASPTNDFGYWQINGVHGPPWPPTTRSGTPRPRSPSPATGATGAVDHLITGAYRSLLRPGSRRAPPAPRRSRYGYAGRAAWQQVHRGPGPDRAAAPGRAAHHHVDQLVEAVATLAVRGARILGAAGARRPLAVRQATAGLGRRPAGRGGQRIADARPTPSTSAARSGGRGQDRRAATPSRRRPGRDRLLRHGQQQTSPRGADWLWRACGSGGFASTPTAAR